MIETPLYGKFQGENRRLVFSAPTAYHMFIRATGAVGVVMVLYGLLGPVLGVELPLYQQWWLGIGALVIFAAVLAALSLHSISFNLKERIYVRRQGPGLFPRVTRGSINDLDAIVLIAENNARLLNGGVTYHLILHWKGQAQPPMVLQQDTRVLTPGQPLNTWSGPLMNRATTYAQALGIKLFDNSHFLSACPVPIWRR
jgi:hypothetical protein